MNACENHVNKRKNTRSGFTIAELLVVVAIISVLVSIMIPVFRYFNTLKLVKLSKVA